MKDSFCHPLKGWFLKQKESTKLLLHSIPAVVVALFVVSVITMNILANKTIYQNEWLAIDGGILVSWLSFLCMDIITKHFGPKASVKITLLAMFINLLTCLIFYIVAKIPTPGMDFTAFNELIGGTWYILLSSTIAFLCSGLVNIWLNFFVGKIFKKNPNGLFAFITRAYISTFIGQFLDNFIFSILTFTIFMPIYIGFSWTVLQCFTCAILGALIELFCEAVFSPFGYYVSRKWQKDNVGEAYLNYVKENA